MMSRKNLPKAYSKVTNWWYHYYSIGLDEKITEVSRKCFCLHPDKVTPDFRNYRYDYGLCHYQIGYDVEPGQSIVVLKTTIGQKNAPPGFIEKAQFMVGYFRVHTINHDEEYITMDKEDSLLLLDDPIRIDLDWAKKLFPEKENKYWLPSKKLVQKVGSMTRNRHIEKRELTLILRELCKRRCKGSSNYLGSKYDCACPQKTDNPEVH